MGLERSRRTTSTTSAFSAAQDIRREHASRRTAGLAAIIGPILFVMVFTVDGFFHGTYSPARLAISYLEVGPHGWVQQVNFVLLGLLLLLFTRGFSRAIRPEVGRGWWRAIRILLVLIALGWINDGIFIAPAPDEPPFAPHVLLHDLGFQVIFLCLIVVSIIAGVQLRKASLWRAAGTYSFLVGLLTLGMMVVFVVSAVLVPQAVGIVNRTLIVVALSWYVAMGLRLLRPVATSGGADT